MDSLSLPEKAAAPARRGRIYVALALFLSTKVAAMAVALLWLMTGLHGCHRDSLPAVRAVSELNTERYMGRWYEVASVPNPFQKGCTATQATYVLQPNGTVRVDNSCCRGGLDRERTHAEGRAWIADTAHPAQLRVQFFWPFSGDYWVLGVAEDYSWAVVGQPSRKYGWILSRSPSLPEKTTQKALHIAAEAGYDPARFERTQQP